MKTVNVDLNEMASLAEEYIDLIAIVREALHQFEDPFLWDDHDSYEFCKFCGCLSPSTHEDNCIGAMAWKFSRKFEGVI